MARVGMVAFIALVVWLFLGGVLGIAGLLLTSLIPFAGLGILLGVLGGLAHIVMIISKRQPKWWKVSLVLSVILSLFSIVSGTLTGNRFPFGFMIFLFSYYWVFGSLIYIVTQKYFVNAFMEK